MPVISEHYSGERGLTYLSHRQRAASPVSAAIDIEYFKPYLTQTDRVLDFGCGTGGIVGELARIVGRADGLEVNQASADLARKTGCTIFDRLEQLPEAPMYDVIVTNHCLEHVRDVCTTLEILRCHLRKGGLLIAKLPIDDFRHPHQRRYASNDIDHHLSTWTPRLFANVLFESGYSVLECRVLTQAWHSIVFPFARTKVAKSIFWLVAVLLKRRQLFAVAQA